jgi:hypothetical protein
MKPEWEVETRYGHHAEPEKQGKIERTVRCNSSDSMLTEVAACSSNQEIGLIKVRRLG